ncbi:MAG TPA: hypothetical protein VG077_00415, partial [Verrucomicrobiae bacterium]|nr:hypothetical protein [Verrucomicrobiae bacterium]
MKIRHAQSTAWAGIALLSLGLSSFAFGQTDTNSSFPDLKKQQERLTLENSIAQQQLQKDLAKLTAEKQRLELQHGLAQQKQQADAAAL